MGRAVAPAGGGGRSLLVSLFYIGEETGLDYNIIMINILTGEQFDPDFLKISPNNRVPAIVDHNVLDENGEPLRLMESGAILYYLATKSGQFLPKDPKQHWQALEWLNWQMGGFGPMLGQAHHFLHFNPGQSEYAENRFSDEARRLYGVLDKRLEGQDFVAGEYSIADMAIWPWASRFEFQKIDLNIYPNVLRWYRTIALRPAVVRGYSVPVGAEVPQP